MAQPFGTKRKPYKHNLSERICRFPGCGNVYVPNNPNQHYCGGIHYSKCAICGKKFVPKNLANVPKTCSSTCGYSLRVKNRVNGYDDIWKQKCINTTLKNHGVMYPMQNDSIKEKSKKTLLKNYGVDHPMKSLDIVKKLSNTVFAKYSVKYACQLPQCRNRRNPISNPCKYIIWFLEIAGLCIETEFALGRYKYDIHVLGTNVLIEVNPTITHNSLFSPFGLPKSEDYHSEKSDFAYSNGYVCFCIWDWTDLIKLRHGLLYCKSFSIVKTDPKLHYYNPKVKQLLDCKSLEHLDGYFPVYDDGYCIDFIY